jgi:hypothetical protein
MDFLKESEKSRIIFALNLLSDKLESGYKLESLNVKDDCIIFSNNNNKQEKISIKKIMELINKKELNNSDIEQLDNKNLQKDSVFETSKMVEKIRNEPLKQDKMVLSETSVMKGGEYTNFSETSEMYEISEMSDIQSTSNKLTGGSKNIFQKSKYSETSSLKESDMSNFSVTSSDIFNSKTNKYSETSDIREQFGGNSNLTSDTLIGISDIKQTKVFKTQTQTQKLDMGIFTKKQQSGGAIDSIKRRMMDVGINSNSSTSSICE